MKNHVTIILLLAVLSFVSSSCGVMFGGSKFNGSIVVNGRPDADIFVNGNKIGTNSAIGLFPRNRPLTVELRKEGCENQLNTFNNTFRGGNFFLSLVCWGLTGIIVDMASGASYKPDHKGNPAIERMSDKNFLFTIDYKGCAADKAAGSVEALKN